MSADEREGFVGSKACVVCHQELSGQIHTRHARSLTPVRAGEITKQVEYFDGVLNAEYTLRMKGNKLEFRVSSDRSDGTAVADYAFGSGAVAKTYVAMKSDPPLELRLSSYRGGEEWNLTPGHERKSFSLRPLGKPMDPRTQEECFLCHSTALVKDDRGLDLKRSLLGVGCETCHGPGRSHVKSAKAGRGSEGMTDLSSNRGLVSLKVCGQCHRSPDNVDLNDPGQLIQLPRWQALAVSLSDCFKKGKVSCVTCHDPHADANARTRPQHNAICMSCHQPSHPKQRACRRAPAGDCISCHMPKQDIGMPTNPTFHNHWIKVWK